MKSKTTVRALGALVFLAGLAAAARAAEEIPAAAVFSGSGEPAEERMVSLNDGELPLPEAAIPAVKVAGESGLGEFASAGDRDYAYEFDYEPAEGKLYPADSGKKLAMIVKWRGKDFSLKDAKAVIKKKKGGEPLQNVCVKVQKGSSWRFSEGGSKKACMILEFCDPDRPAVKKGKVLIWSDGGKKVFAPAPVSKGQ